jgi:hypothetical protein
MNNNTETIEQSILSIEDAAIKESEKQFPYNDFRGKEKGVDDEHTGQALRGACVGGFEAGWQQREQQLLPIIKELGEALNIAKKAVPQFEYGQGERFETDVYAKIQTTIDKYKNYL